VISEVVAELKIARIWLCSRRGGLGNGDAIMLENDTLYIISIGILLHVIQLSNTLSPMQANEGYNEGM